MRIKRNHPDILKDAAGRNEERRHKIPTSSATKTTPAPQTSLNAEPPLNSESIAPGPATPNLTEATNAKIAERKYVGRYNECQI